MEIKKAAVIGAGVMGAGIAAQLANAGIEVELLDIVPKTAGDDRDMIAKGAIEKMAKTAPAPLMHKSNAKRIRPGNTEDHLERLKECDLIIEVVIENPKIKSALFAKIDANRKPGSIVASNTSTIPLKVLIDGQSDQFKKDCVITHFFNPPRYMPLLELVTSKHNSKDTVATVTKFMDEKMGKTVVACNDTPGFIANRIGTFWIECAINEAYKRGMQIEQADAIVGRPMGVPKTGVFGLVDLVGLDLMPHISKSLKESLPANDSYCKISGAYPELTAVINKMIADGFTGRKGKGGFYRLKPGSEKKEKETVDLKTGQYRDTVEFKKSKALSVAKSKGLKALIQHKSPEGDYAWSVVKQTLTYAASLVPEIANDLAAVDAAMRLGYNWKQGPFEMIDKLGADYLIERLEKEGEKVPNFLREARGRTFYKTENGKLQQLNIHGFYEDIKRPDGVLLLSDIKRGSKPVADNTINVPKFGTLGAKLWDIGDGVLCLEFCSKMNSMDHKILGMINKACDLIGDGKGKYKALVVHNEGDDFSVGANLGLAVGAASIKQHWLIDKLVEMGQDTYKRLKYSPFPVVSAPSGKALGGGCEILLHSNAVVAHSETYMGLVEVGVGLIPGWGGCAEMLGRATTNKKMPKGPIPPVAAVFETISTAKVAFSAQEAKDLMYLRDTDTIVMNKSRLLFEAKKKAIEMSKDFTPPKPVTEMVLPGPTGKAALDLAVDGFYLKGAATPYDVVVSDHLATVLTGGCKADITVKVSEDDIRTLEREMFAKLSRDQRTLNRIKTILKTNKPLREKPITGKTSISLRKEGSKMDLVTTAVTKVTGKRAKNSFDAACMKACKTAEQDNKGAAKKAKKPAKKP